MGAAIKTQREGSPVERVTGAVTFRQGMQPTTGNPTEWQPGKECPNHILLSPLSSPAAASC